MISINRKYFSLSCFSHFGELARLAANSHSVAHIFPGATTLTAIRNVLAAFYEHVLGRVWGGS
jgi:hypothetical protein